MEAVEINGGEGEPEPAERISGVNCGPARRPSVRDAGTASAARRCLTQEAPLCCFIRRHRRTGSTGRARDIVRRVVCVRVTSVPQGSASRFEADLNEQLNGGPKHHIIPNFPTLICRRRLDLICVSRKVSCLQ